MCHLQVTTRTNRDAFRQRNSLCTLAIESVVFDHARRTDIRYFLVDASVANGASNTQAIEVVDEGQRLMAGGEKAVLDRSL